MLIAGLCLCLCVTLFLSHRIGTFFIYASFHWWKSIRLIFILYWDIKSCLPSILDVHAFDFILVGMAKWTICMRNTITYTNTSTHTRGARGKQNIKNETTHKNERKRKSGKVKRIMVSNSGINSRSYLKLLFWNENNVWRKYFLKRVLQELHKTLNHIPFYDAHSTSYICASVISSLCLSLSLALILFSFRCCALASDCSRLLLLLFLRISEPLFIWLILKVKYQSMRYAYEIMCKDLLR